MEDKELSNKICRLCNKNQPIINFYNKWGAKRTFCTDCANEKVELKSKLLRRCLACREIKSINDFPFEDKKRNILTPRCKKCHAPLQTKERERRLHYCIFKSSQIRARHENLPFNLELSDIVIPEFCPVLGLKLKVNSGGWSDTSPSIDKVIPEMGYVKGNIRIISFRANRIKNSSTKDECEKITQYIRDNSPEQIEYYI